MTLTFIGPNKYVTDIFEKSCNEKMQFLRNNDKNDFSKGFYCLYCKDIG